METDQRSPASPNHQGTSDEQAASPVRSYDCAFCKRGFSSAQALGGHMNIHRKDKVKLKRVAASSNDSNQQSFDISKVRASYSPIPTNRIWSSMEFMATRKERSSNTKWRPRIPAGEENDATESYKIQPGEVRKLPVFVRRPLRIDRQPRLAGSQIHAGSTEKELSPGSSGSNLDLELRLGLEPKGSTSSTGTKKLF